MSIMPRRLWEQLHPNPSMADLLSRLLEVATAVGEGVKTGFRAPPEVVSELMWFHAWLKPLADAEQAHSN
jgi:hypothetical protein